ncbi:CKLF-like MARVEL transmembrane domain-containing protein 7 isoform X2 [Misgurnus anguillicaudatus]|uniref:CKLF-like MARVEL transmembrane domain-containing protein 7 isoform X2 n=1 Tax=Misgurnus anguillicaudatus TaxID=75329 RepID=UPI003CCF3BBD
MMVGFLALEHLKSNQGILKIVQLVILVVAFACVHSTWYSSIYAYGFFEGVTLGYSVAIALFLILTVFGAPKRIEFVKWTVVEFVLDILGFVFVTTGSIVAAVKSCEATILVAASVCGLLVSYLIAGSVMLSYFATRHSNPENQPV